MSSFRNLAHIHILAPSSMPAGQRPAAADGGVYSFRGADGRRQFWPRGDSVSLGPVGAWNAFRRLGWPTTWVTTDDLGTLDASALLVVDASVELPSEVGSAFERFVQRGGRALCAGPSPTWQRRFGFAESTRCADVHYAALAARYDAHAHLWSCEAQRCFTGFPASCTHSGELCAVLGERQSPDRALLHPLNAPLLSSCGSVI